MGLWAKPTPPAPRGIRAGGRVWLGLVSPAMHRVSIHQYHEGCGVIVQVDTVRVGLNELSPRGGSAVSIKEDGAGPGVGGMNQVLCGSQGLTAYSGSACCLEGEVCREYRMRLGQVTVELANLGGRHLNTNMVIDNGGNGAVGADGLGDGLAGGGA